MESDRRYSINMFPANDSREISVRSRVPTPAPRQYRPTYNHASAYPTPNFGYSLANRSQQGYNRRRTAPAFPASGLLYGPPTVASSGITASVSVNDISRPTPSNERKRSQPRYVMSSRIPTPILDQDSPKSIASDRHGVSGHSPKRGNLQDITNDSQPKVQEPSTVDKHYETASHYTSIESGKMGHRRSFAISGTSSIPKMKENVLPKQDLHSSPIHVRHIESTGIPMPRTRDVLATLTSSISASRSTPSLGTSGSTSAVSLLARSSTRLVSLPLSNFSDEFGQVSHHVPSSYWAGRFTTLHDRYRGEVLDPPFLEIHRSKVCNEGPEEENESAPYSRDEEKLGKRVFLHLEALCLTIEAKASLWRFQQHYARLVNCDALLPVGGSMGSQNNIMAKARRMLPGRRKTGNAVTNCEVNRKRSSLNVGSILE